ncbi:MAG TPA: CshA/CshB family fibrillar adhesin-related protein [Acidimicrobiales bacterium]|nr:CshA/CshB family fibrillar adhesin-related protein [Acidimicrobiales bacterium]
MARVMARMGRPWARLESRSRRAGSDEGFTLIELIVVTAIMPLVFGAIAVAMISVLSTQNNVSSELTDQGDAQVISASYQTDVQSAAMITTDSTPTSPAPCESGSQYQVLGLQLGNQSEITYAVVPIANGNTTTYDLLRNFCDGTDPMQSHVEARDVPSSMLQAGSNPVSIACLSGAAACALTAGTPAYVTSWQSTVGITGVTFADTEPGSNYSFQLTAVPAASVSSTQLAQVVQPASTCGFALPGTGTYASTLCFVDFTNWNTQTAAKGFSCSGGAVPMSSTIANTPFILTFCLSASGTDSNHNPITGPVSAPAACGVLARSGYYDITASPLPTYSCPPGSEAFLGNNGFYTGVSGNPALYTVEQGSTAVVSITNIALQTSQGIPATNWELVTGDAESTDANESITWTSDKALQLLPNSANSPVGNACDSTAPGYNSQYLTGLGTTTVECSSPTSADHTGAVMLEALTPSSLTVTLVGTGLQGVFLGVLLS